MAKDTKERILAAALELFSEKGYAGTNIRELTASLGLVKSSLYKHFESKEQIWNALLDEMIAYYAARFGSPDQLPPVPDSPEALVAMTMRMVDFTVHDEKIVKTRKVLAIEQFRDDRARALASKHFLTGLTEIFTPIFASMMDKGLLRRDDPAMLAFAYTAPISSLIHLCDREPEKTAEALQQVEAFSRHFIRTYGRIVPVTVRKLTAREIQRRWTLLGGCSQNLNPRTTPPRGRRNSAAACTTKPTWPGSNTTAPSTVKCLWGRSASGRTKDISASSLWKAGITGRESARGCSVRC